ncbi:hypothetical protein DFH09DRAFT_1103323 [Mycena vulgaris]|nr:hypothetical protein DFH09DRAFT_1103323 [Mycena vulgaris]
MKPTLPVVPTARIGPVTSALIFRRRWICGCVEAISDGEVGFLRIVRITHVENAVEHVDDIREVEEVVETKLDASGGEPGGKAAEGCKGIAEEEGPPLEGNMRNSLLVASTLESDANTPPKAENVEHVQYLSLGRTGRTDFDGTGGKKSCKLPADLSTLWIVATTGPLRFATGNTHTDGSAGELAQVISAGCPIAIPRATGTNVSAADMCRADEVKAVWAAPRTLVRHAPTGNLQNIPPLPARQPAGPRSNAKAVLPLRDWRRGMI